MEIIENFLISAPGTTPLDTINIPLIVVPLYMPFVSYEFSKTILRSTEIADFLKQNEKFDICIVELFLGEALLVNMLNKLTHNNV